MRQQSKAVVEIFVLPFISLLCILLFAHVPVVYLVWFGFISLPQSKMLLSLKGVLKKKLKRANARGGRLNQMILCGPFQPD